MYYSNNSPLEMLGARGVVVVDSICKSPIKMGCCCRCCINQSIMAVMEFKWFFPCLLASSNQGYYMFYGVTAGSHGKKEGETNQ